MPYPMLDNDAYVGCVVPADLRSQWEIVRRADREGLPRALRRLGGIDMCHYDSDKSYRGRMWAYPLLWESLRSGGFLLSDDVSDNIAFRDFVAAAGVDPVIIAFEGKHIGIVRR